MIKLQAKRIELNFLLKFSDPQSNFTLTLGYLNPALNNPGLGVSILHLHLTNEIKKKEKKKKQPSNKKHTTFMTNDLIATTKIFWKPRHLP